MTVDRGVAVTYKEATRVYADALGTSYEGACSGCLLNALDLISSIVADGKLRDDAYERARALLRQCEHPDEEAEWPA